MSSRSISLSGLDMLLMSTKDDLVSVDDDSAAESGV